MGTTMKNSEVNFICVITGLSCLDGALLASKFLSLMLLRGGLGAVMSPALMRGTL